MNVAAVAVVVAVTQLLYKKIKCERTKIDALSILNELRWERSGERESLQFHCSSPTILFLLRFMDFYSVLYCRYKPDVECNIKG